jgi:hypothetical protein
MRHLASSNKDMKGHVSLGLEKIRQILAHVMKVLMAKG